MSSISEPLPLSVESHPEKILQEIAEKIFIDKLEAAVKNNKSFKSVENNSDKVVHGKWMAMILVCGADLEVTLKVHYDSQVGRLLLSAASKKDVNDIDPCRIQDFFREYCNTCAGELKAILAKQNISVGLSLPLSLRGSDQIVFAQQGEYANKSKLIKVESDFGSFACSTHLEIINRDALRELKIPEEPIKTKKRKIAFL